MMDKTNRNKQIFRIRILAFAVLVCAWLLPTSVGIASSASSKMKISLTVVDAVGVNYGRSALQLVSGNQIGQVTTEFVTRTASSRLAGGMVVDEVRGPEATAEHRVPFGPGTETGPGDAVSSGDHDDYDTGESEVVVTVSNL